jgi:hypothetical protein
MSDATQIAVMQQRASAVVTVLSSHFYYNGVHIHQRVSLNRNEQLL